MTRDRTRERQLCPYSGKVSYLSRSDAEWALKAIVAGGSIERRDANRLIVYTCKSCGRFHLGRPT